MSMNEQPVLPGVEPSLSEQISNLVRATRERIIALEAALVAAKDELASAKKALAAPRKAKVGRKPKAKVVKAKVPKGGKKKGGRPKGSKNKPKIEASAPEAPKEA